MIIIIIIIITIICDFFMEKFHKHHQILLHYNISAVIDQEITKHWVVRIYIESMQLCRITHDS